MDSLTKINFQTDVYTHTSMVNKQPVFMHAESFKNPISLQFTVFCLAFKGYLNYWDSIFAVSH